jgi:hypothetical protein
VIDAAHTISVPRVAPADSFVLHAPLELMARVGLLPHVAADARDDAIARIEALAEQYTATGPGVDAPNPLAFASIADAMASLAGAIGRSDLEVVDATMLWLTACADATELRVQLGDTIVAALGAAAHTPIGLYLLPRVGDRRLPAALLRAPVRELARHPDWQLRWFRDLPERAGDARDLEAALRAVPHLGRPGSDFVFPLMSQAEQSGVAAQLLGPQLATDVDTARRTLTRAAAWSMLHDDPDQAPYGWTHCLTMPQAVMGLAGDGIPPRTAIAVAGTFVVGFRAAHGLQPLGDLGEGAAQPTTGASRTELATFAALHHDAHVVKYTLACFYAAADDPAWAATYLAAAAYLADWWRNI